MVVFDTDKTLSFQLLMLLLPILAVDRRGIPFLRLSAQPGRHRTKVVTVGARRRGRPVVDGPVVVMVLVVVIVPEFRVVDPRSRSEQAYVDFRFNIIDAIAEHGGSPSHNYGIGKMIAGCTKTHLGTSARKATRALKGDFNSNGIFDPGGRLALDLPGTERRAICPRGDSESR